MPSRRGVSDEHQEPQRDASTTTSSSTTATRSYDIPDLRRAPDQVLRGVPAGRGAARRAARPRPRGASCARCSRSSRTTRRCARVRRLRARPAALHARRVPRAALTYGSPFKIRVRLAEARARRGGGLPRRDPDHDRRRRVHHERLRARDREPAAPLARRGLLGRRRTPARRSCTRAGSSPSAARWIELERHARRTCSAIRIDQSGKFPATTLLRAMDEEYSTDEALIRLFYDDEGRRRSTTSKQPAKDCSASTWSATSSTPATGEILIVAAARRSREESRRPSLESEHRSSVEVIDEIGRPADPEHARRGHDQAATRRRCSRSTAACARATRRSSRRPASSSTRSSSTRPATASAGSAASASTASSSRTIPEDEQTLHRRTSSTAIRYLLDLRARTRARSTTSTTSATGACARSTSWPARSSARAS